ncbi:MAG: glycosyltransferase, partial [Candidatus Edwardsbacteria bacterium]|nr:glycosyltransferase [Candidatus Edwardsbacteria bacterium]
MVNVAIIILNWNNSELTLKAAKSIIWQNNIVTKVIIADNGSTDCSYDQLKLLPKIDLLKFNCNYGFAGGNNRAVKYAMSRYNPEYVLLLNNDAELEGNALNILFDNCEKADILSPKIYYGDRKTLWSCGGKIDLW